MDPGHGMASGIRLSLEFRKRGPARTAGNAADLDSEHHLLPVQELNAVVIIRPEKGLGSGDDGIAGE